MKLKRFLLLSSVSVLVLAVLTPVVFDRLIAGRYLRHLHATKIAPNIEKNYVHFEQFKKDVEILKPKIEFLNFPKVADAGPYLNALLSWDFGDNSKNATVTISQGLVISEKLRSVLRHTDKSLMVIDAKSFKEVNTTWLHKLRQFDYWDLDKNSPVDQFERFSFSTPLPNFDVAFAKVHLIKAQDKNDEQYSDAIQDVLHYGELSLSTETLIGEMIFVATLGLANKAIEARPQVKSKFTLWTPLISERDRLKRVYWGVIQFSTPRIAAKAGHWKSVYHNHWPSLGLCGAVREVTAVDWMTWSLLSDALGSEYADYRKVLSTHPNGCRLTWIKEKTPAWVKLPHEPDLYFEPKSYFMSGNSQGSLFLKTIAPITRVVQWMPETRRLIGTILGTIAFPNFTAQYEKPLTSEKEVRLPTAEEAL